MERSPDSRRRARLFATPAAFVVWLLVVAAIVAGIILVVYAVGGFGEGSEGALAVRG